MEGNAPINFLVSVLSIGLLFYIVFFAYQSYRVARFRYKVFKLRDELFQEAAGGFIGFDHNAYKAVRILMNGHIRFAHTMTLWQPVLLYLIERFRGKLEPDERSFYATYERATSDLDEKTKDRLDVYIDKLDGYVMRHIFFALPEFMVLTIPMFIVFLTRALVKMLPRLTFTLMEGFTRNRVMDAAFAVGERAAQQTPATATRNLVASR